MTPPKRWGQHNARRVSGFGLCSFLMFKMSVSFELAIVKTNFGFHKALQTTILINVKMIFQLVSGTC